MTAHARNFHSATVRRSQRRCTISAIDLTFDGAVQRFGASL
jgi:hypothetical protein